jgi:hypothetical protein
MGRSTDAVKECLATAVTWTRRDDALRPWETVVAGAHWAVELGDFPDEPLYSLWIDGRKVGEFDDWPTSWTRPN